MKARTVFKRAYRDGTANKDNKIRGPRKAAPYLPYTYQGVAVRYNEKGMVARNTGRVLKEWEVHGEKLRGDFA